MMKNRSYLLGLGTGLTVGAILLELMNAVVSPGNHSAALQPSPGAAQAQSHLNPSSSSQADQTNQQMNELRKQLKAAQQKLEAESNKLNTLNKEKPIYLYISQQMDAESVGELLLAAGVIQDIQKYREDISDHKLSKKIQVGSYEFAQNESVHQVIQKITSVQ